MTEVTQRFIEKYKPSEWVLCDLNSDETVQSVPFDPAGVTMYVERTGRYKARLLGVGGMELVVLHDFVAAVGHTNYGTTNCLVAGDDVTFRLDVSLTSP